MYYSTTFSSPVGLLTLACDGKQLIGLWLSGQKYHGGCVDQPLHKKDDLAVFNATKEWLNNYFSGEKPAISELPLAPIGGEFRQTVWDLLREIPYGEVTSYGTIAKKVATKLHRQHMSAQAVGGAVGHNPISIVIPCHRVVGSNGSLTGYASGLAMKQKLLELEGVDMSLLFTPHKGTAL
ncbi:MAG: methylated-DNA--[protein]-cysteine S-methyltransferase [Propionibacteriaceae bacterium]|jgi:methylated-DNA-[protein]-cysteine S-methyltransferase|nr:methylated-DNA--[protein]-cysteine S-methyltransferase [Propionibacteriaceae bacterium]